MVMDILKAIAFARQALQRLEKDAVEPSPENYAVYYHYYLGDIPALNAAYDAITGQGAMTQADCAALYKKYIDDYAEAAFIKDASSIIDSELKKVMALVGESLKGSDEFDKNLNQFSGALAVTSSIDALKSAVEKITSETRLVTSQNKKLQNELTETTAQLVEMRDDFDRIHKESQIDSLTEVGNRKFFDHEIASAMESARLNDTVLSLLMVDIDHFKKFNDTHGHLIGDQVLRLVARTMVENLKGRDIIARYGGEEFGIILPMTRVEDAERVANHLRASLATKNIRRRGSTEILGVVTISLGAAEYVSGEDKDSFISRADAALYKAKQTGRNKVVCAPVTQGASA